MYAEYQRRGGKVHPNGPLQTKPWGTKEFGAIDPNGVCVTFQEIRVPHAQTYDAASAAGNAGTLW
jgi:hypothetical protein